MRCERHPDYDGEHWVDQTRGAACTRCAALYLTRDTSHNSGVRHAVLLLLAAADNGEAIEAHAGQNLRTAVQTAFEREEAALLDGFDLGVRAMAARFQDRVRAKGA